jgi:hypothetical protein
MTLITQVIVWLNGLANTLASVLLAPVAVLPGWASATLIAAVTGVLMLLVFKWTSNQGAIKRVRNEIKANLLALTLFQDSVVVSLRSQARILRGAGRLLLLAFVPMLVMLIPVSLLLGQISVWYQARPLRVGEETVVTVHLSASSGEALPEVRLTPSTAIEPIVGPVRVVQKRMVCWNVLAREPGCHQLRFEANGQTFAKELAIGSGFMRLSILRPGWRWTDAMLYPLETPFDLDSVVQAIEVAYPQRQSWTAGTNSWLLYWFAASMAFAFAIRPLLRVSL